MISTWEGLCAGERRELIAETSQGQSFGERINLISTFQEKGGLSLYQFMLQHIRAVNLFVEGLIKKKNKQKTPYLLCSLKTQEGKNKWNPHHLSCCKSFKQSLWGLMVWSLLQLKWFFFYFFFPRDLLVSQVFFWPFHLKRKGKLSWIEQGHSLNEAWVSASPGFSFHCLKNTLRMVGADVLLLSRLILLLLWVWAAFALIPPILAAV